MRLHFSFVRKLFLFPSLLLISPFVFSQNCSFQVSGLVRDQLSKNPLELANIYVEETSQGAVADLRGFFRLENLCAGNYHLRISHVSCESQRVFLKISRDTVISVFLAHHEEFLQEISINGDKIETPTTRTQNTIGTEQLQRESGKNLAQILENITGVNSIKSGSGIAKPVIHGLYGNRIAILNHGLVQAGQQWGNDHAPEIDPHTAQKISVVKGVEAIEYGGNTLGGAVLVEPSAISSDPDLHGALHYVFNTNGLGHTLSGKVEKSGGWADWRVVLSAKMIGDRHTPDYFLTNTGSRELNGALQLSKNFGKLKTQVYYSIFNTEMGILRGSHIGNLTDLQAAIGQGKPFFTNEYFSYEINPPRQVVQHHLLKISARYLLENQAFINLTYGGQLNSRQEFDVRRSGRSSIPSLDLTLQSHFVDAQYHFFSEKNQELKMGLQGKFNSNGNEAGTGILPLIPNYDLWNGAAYLMYKRNTQNWFYETGGRYDFYAIQVRAISRDLSRTVENVAHFFHNYSLSSGLGFQKSSVFSSKINIGLTQRSPEVNEMYSFGLHQGVSGIEEGNRALRAEKSLKAIWTNTYSLHSRFLGELSIYYQNIQDYIFLEPQKEFRLTIRGAFPVFLYKQTDATIAGIDALLKYEILKNIEWIGKYSMVRGTDTKNAMPLVYMPANQVFSSLAYEFPKFGKVQDMRLLVQGRYVFRQNNLNENQDFLSPPPAYWLFGTLLEAKIIQKKITYHLHFQIDNLLNIRYRDYLNRLRYYADEEGRNLRIGLRMEF